MKKDIDTNLVNKIIKNQIDKFDRTFTIKELEAQALKNKQAAMKVIFKNGKITVIRLDEKFKNNRKNYLEHFLKLVAKKYPNINTTIYCNVYDWGCHDDKDYPFFTMSGFYGTKNFVIPEYLFLRDYDKRNGRNDDKEPMNKLIEKYRNINNWDDKISKCFFRAGTSKNKVIVNMFKNHPLVDAKWSRDSFLTYEEMFKHKYVISHYMRWDSIYFFLKSNIVVFLYNGFNQYLWYDLFLLPGEHYIPFNNLEEFNKKIEIVKNNDVYAQKIIRRGHEMCDTYFNIDFAVDYMGLLLQEYQKLIRT